MTWYQPLLERDWLPDTLVRAGIRNLLGRRLAEESEKHRRSNGRAKHSLVEELRQSPVAVHTDAANEQHYEVPAEFFTRVLGPHRKYSSALWPDGVPNLGAAEEAMLALTAERARLADGQEILELGCGWGSLTLYLAQRFPAARVTGLSNSGSQKAFIDAEAARRGLRNVEVVTADINRFVTERRFDRVVSVEMFEHVRNYRTLFQRIAAWLKPDGLLFVHIFCHAHFAYPFETDGKDDWMARYFFTGGLMPSADLFAHFQEDLRLVGQWAVNGQHYEKTCNAWLANLDRERAAVIPILSATYGRDQAQRWRAYWRIFFMACAELFGYRDGREWFVSHYLFQRAG